jgi:hypothetical protein
LGIGLESAQKYASSLVLKKCDTLYHKKNVEKRLSEIQEKRLKLSTGKLIEYEFEITFELDALVSTLNTVWDVLAQLINECFIRIDICNVSFTKFSNPKHPYYKLVPPKIQRILTSIRGNTLYRDIYCFTNISKHRYAVSGELVIDFSKESQSISYSTVKLEYKKREWHTFTDEKAFKCVGFMIDSVNRVGFTINQLLKQRGETSTRNG